MQSVHIVYNVSFVCWQCDEDLETYDTLVELDELLNLDTQVERAEYLQVFYRFMIDDDFMISFTAFKMLQRRWWFSVIPK